MMRGRTPSSAVPKVALGEVIELAYGKALPTRIRQAGCVPVYGSNGRVDTHNEAYIDGPTIIVGRKGSVGAVHYVSGPCYPIDTTYYVKIRPTVEVDLEYLYWLLLHLNLSRIKTETGVPGLNREDAYRELVSLPSFEVQRRIADILNRVDSIRRLRVQAIEITKELIPTLFVDIFGDPATNPKGWEVRSLGEVIGGFEGGKNIQAGEDSPANPFRILKVSAVTSGYFRPEEAKPAPDGYAPPANHFVRKGDLLFSRANTVELVGATALVEEGYKNLLLPDKLWRFVWREPSAVLPAYMQHFLQSRYVRQELGRLATGTSDSMRNISQAKLKTVPVPIPPLQLQAEFAAHVESVIALSKQQKAHAENSERLMQSLMAQYFG